MGEPHAARHGAGGRPVQFTVAANADPAARAGAMNVGEERLQVSQEGRQCEFRLSSTGESVDRAGGERTIQVSASSAQCQWTAASGVPWIDDCVGPREQRQRRRHASRGGRERPAAHGHDRHRRPDRAGRAGHGLRLHDRHGRVQPRVGGRGPGCASDGSCRLRVDCRQRRAVDRARERQHRQRSGRRELPGGGH